MKLKNDDFLNYFNRSETVQNEWKIGLEQEVFGFYKNSITRINYSTIAEILNSFVKNYNWQPVYEEGKIISEGLLEVCQ